MLKALTTRCSSHVAFGTHLRRLHVTAGEPASPLRRLILGQNKRSLFILRRFCSDSSDGSTPDDGAPRVKSGEDAAAESKLSSAIVPTVVRPEDCLTVGSYNSLVTFSAFWIMATSIFIYQYIFLQVVALPLSHRPLFPGFYMPVYVKVQRKPFLFFTFFSWQVGKIEFISL